MKTESISIPTRIPKSIVDQVDYLVDQGIFTSRSEFIREAIRDYLADEVKRMQAHRLSFTIIERNLLGKVKHKEVKGIVEETRKIRKELWEKRK